MCPLLQIFVAPTWYEVLTTVCQPSFCAYMCDTRVRVFAEFAREACLQPSCRQYLLQVRSSRPARGTRRTLICVLPLIPVLFHFILRVESTADDHVLSLYFFYYRTICSVFFSIIVSDDDLFYLFPRLPSLCERRTFMKAQLLQAQDNLPLRPHHRNPHPVPFLTHLTRRGVHFCVFRS